MLILGQSCAPQMVLNGGLGGGKLVIGLCLRPGVALGIRLCAVVELFPLQVGLNPFKKENVDVYILAVTPSWPLCSSIPTIAVTSS